MEKYITKDNRCQNAEEVGYQSANHCVTRVLYVYAAEIDGYDIESGVRTALYNAH